MLLLGFVRTSILIPVITAIVLLFVVSKMTVKRRLLCSGIIGLTGFVFLLAPMFSLRFGSYPFDYIRLLDWVTRRDETFLGAMTWSERSLGQILIPNSHIEAVVFVIPRMIFYLVSPLPKIGFTLSGLVSGSWLDWQLLMMSMSSLFYIALFPLALVALINAVRKKEWKNALVFHIPYWLMLLTVAGGNQIIHERYRVMATLLFWGCIWLGQTCDSKLVRQAYIVWSTLLITIGLFYWTYKLLL